MLKGLDNPTSDESRMPSPTTSLSTLDSESTEVDDNTFFFDLEPWEKELEHLLITTPHDILIHDIASDYKFTHLVCYIVLILGYHA